MVHGTHIYPLVNQHSYKKWPCIYNFPRKNVILHSYIRLPEGNIREITPKLSALSQVSEIFCDSPTMGIWVSKVVKCGGWWWLEPWKIIWNTRGCPWIVKPALQASKVFGVLQNATVQGWWRFYREEIFQSKSRWQSIISITKWIIYLITTMIAVELP